MISIVIPVYNPNLIDFKSALASALETYTNEIIIVDDCSDKTTHYEYFSFLESIDDKRVKIFYNLKNLGRFDNSFYALSLATNEYVRKLDADDEIVPSGFNKILEIEFTEDLIFTQYTFNNKLRNKCKEDKWNLFNGSLIYRASHFKNNNFDNGPKKFFGDTIFMLNIMKSPKCTVKYIRTNAYNYKVIGSTTPLQLLNHYKDWLVGYNWIVENGVRNEISLFTIEKQLLFAELIFTKLDIKYNKQKYKYYKGFYYVPKFLRKIISNFVFKK